MWPSVLPAQALRPGDNCTTMGFGSLGTECGIYSRKRLEKQASTAVSERLAVVPTPVDALQYPAWGRL